MSLFTRLAPAVLVFSMLGAGAGCVEPVGQEPADVVDPIDATATTSSALSATAGGASPGKFILDIATDLLAGNITKLISGEEVDYERINKMFEADLQKYANKEHVRDAGVHVTGALITLRQIVQSYEPNDPNPIDLRTLYQSVDRLNNDLVSMREEDAKKVGLRSYLWAATVQHTLLQTLAVMDEPNAAHWQGQLRLALQDHADYVGGRIPEFQQDAATRISKVDACKYDWQPFIATYEWFDDQGADYGNDPAVPNVEGRDYGSVANYRSDRAWAWGVNAGSQAHNIGRHNGKTWADDCEAVRSTYLADMQTKLDVLNGFTADANLPDTRVLLQQWQKSLADLGGPVAK